MQITELKAIVESLIFVSEEPITEKQILTVLEEASVSSEELSLAIEQLKLDSNGNSSRGLKLVEIAGGYQYRTKENQASWIQKLNVPKPVKLSQAALETLAIVAYRQPVVRSEVESIRGVDAGAVLKTLLERNLIRIVGRKDEAGQPLIYGTSHEFLETFNLKNLHELPSLSDIEELVKKKVETQTPTELPFMEVQSDEEEPTQIIEDESDEEETEIIKREDHEDENILVSIEQGLKDLRRLEKDIFPKPEADQNNEADQTQGIIPTIEVAINATGQENSPAEVDSTEDKPVT